MSISYTHGLRPNDVLSFEGHRIPKYQDPNSRFYSLFTLWLFTNGDDHNPTSCEISGIISVCKKLEIKFKFLYSQGDTPIKHYAVDAAQNVW